MYTYGEGLVDGTIAIMSISSGSNGKPVITIAPVVGSESVDDWSAPVTLQQSGDD